MVLYTIHSTNGYVDRYCYTVLGFISVRGTKILFAI